MSDYYTESQVNQIEQDAHDGAILEAGKEWERQRDEFNFREYELETRIAELEAFIDQLIEAGNELTANPAIGNYEEREAAWTKLWLKWKARNELE